MAFISSSRFAQDTEFKFSKESKFKFEAFWIRKRKQIVGDRYFRTRHSVKEKSHSNEWDFFMFSSNQKRK